DRDRRGEADLLPAGRGLAAEGRAGQQRAGARPELADVAAGVAAALVEAHAVDDAVEVGLELEADLDRAGRAVREAGRDRVVPDRAGAVAQPHVDGPTGRRRLQIAAVVDRSAEDRRRPDRLRRPAVAPARPPGRAVPGRAAVGRDLDPAD